MSTIKLHWIQTDPNDLLTSDTYVIEGSDFTTSSLVHEAEEFVLPEGYTVGETNGGEIAIFDNKGNHCHLDRFTTHPTLSSSIGVAHLKKYKPTKK